MKTKRNEWKLEVCPKCYSDYWIWIEHNTKIACMDGCKKESIAPLELSVIEKK